MSKASDEAETIVKGILGLIWQGMWVAVGFGITAFVLAKLGWLGLLGLGVR